jgi:hypothetical protein
VVSELNIRRVGIRYRWIDVFRVEVVLGEKLFSCRKASATAVRAVVARGVAAVPGTAHTALVQNTPVCGLGGGVVTSPSDANAEAFACNSDGNDVPGDHALNLLNGGLLNEF